MDAKTILDKVKNHTPTVLGSKDFRKFSILVPLIEKEGELHLLFEVRSHKLRSQPGEICFPGGRMDPEDKTEQDAALRETEEELGIRTEDVTAVWPLDYMVSPFGMIVYSFAGFIRPDAAFRPNPAEVEDLFSVPLDFFLETDPQVYRIDFDVQPEEGFPYELITGGEDYNWRTRHLDELFYLFEDKVIWGLTARILAHFLEIIRK